jgi:hypothetical protein
MSNSISVTDCWKDIVSEKQHEFTQLGSIRISRVTNQASFRQYFEAECERLKQTRTQTLLGRLFTSFRRRESFIHILNRATLHQGWNVYAGLVWGAPFGVLEASFPYMYLDIF